MELQRTGKVWKCGDDITTYEIIAQTYWNMERPDPDPVMLGQHVFENVTSRDQNENIPFSGGAYDIVVAGKNFGCGGKSIKHPVVALIGAGVTCVVGESFSRYFFRNAINNGLPAITCPGISKFVNTGDHLKLDYENSIIINRDQDTVIAFNKFPSFILDVINAGGQLAYFKNKLYPSIG